MKTTLYLMVGYPGAGKTTVANLIAKITGAEHLWTARERLSRFGTPKEQYTTDENKELYSNLNQKAKDFLESGKSVVFDTSFNYKKDRDKLRKIAHESGAETKVVWVQTPRIIAQTRATEDAHLQETRILGDMSEGNFNRLSDNLEKPSDDEKPIVIEGIDVTEDIVRNKL